jgi:hypothetical protein
VLEGATMLHDMFARGAKPALERRIAWAVDCARIEDAMYWLAVRDTMYGQPI